jgi:hypothetical protein
MTLGDQNPDNFGRVIVLILSGKSSRREACLPCFKDQRIESRGYENIRQSLGCAAPFLSPRDLMEIPLRNVGKHLELVGTRNSS